ncbi:MAG: peroxide stress protein YaaA [Janthinobacterium lividum]
MIIVLSPAKSLDFDTPPHIHEHTLPDLLDDSTQLIAALRRLSPAAIARLMRVSDPLAHLNFERFASWRTPFDAYNAKQSVLAFDGDVYAGLDAASLTGADLDHAQRHLRILSGLYGVLRPLDLIQPYRLEMGARFANDRGRDLYAFWDTRVADALNHAFDAHPRAGERVLINLASEEYFKSVTRGELRAPVVTPVFEDWKTDRYKIVSFHAKRARGLMARYATMARLDRAEGLKAFAADGYAFAAEASGANRWVFRRRQH